MAHWAAGSTGYDGGHCESGCLHQNVTGVVAVCVELADELSLAAVLGCHFQALTYALSYLVLAC